MFEWIARNHQLLSVLTNIGMLVVWIAYLQLFIGSYRRERRPKILINHGAGKGLGARCLVSNMSAEAIYIESIIATLETAEGRSTCPVTDLESQEERDALTDLKLPTRQGPLQSGHVMDIGSFQILVDHVLRHSTCGPDKLDPEAQRQPVTLEITVAAVYGSEDLLTGARRRFDIAKREGDFYVKAHTVDTEQVRSRRERKKISDMLNANL